MPALKGHVAAWRTAMGDLEVARIDYGVLDEQAQTWLREGDATPATINRRMASLRRAIRLAVRRRLAARTVEVPRLEEAPPRDGFLAPSDFVVLASHLPEGLSLFVRFLYATGMRVGEARQLEWRDVDGLVLRIRGETAKNKKARTLPIRGEVAKIIAKARKQRRLDCPRIFHQAGTPIGDFRKAWAVACKAAGQTGIRPHDLLRGPQSRP
jgi:integrase